MANMNKKSPGQGKTKKQYENSAKTTFYGWCGVIFMVIILFLFTLLGGCATTHDVSKECCKSKTISAE